ncbi:hypothetical protein BHU72_10345 [Desulfuribacillus stibiiarsenatis]|uniref:Prenylated flavin chaperone LpdD-like domain-containing protein n=1 Tax=Desulfuribacillus stibiiarsenatis TaxID=1390249 RepID=A0A1E5L983_9FIRM|nr:hypothetical protein BHU72_10345 [Desulfuribacillus stibiiarsenatis]
MGEKPYCIEILGQNIGEDLYVCIAGGTKPHIGAVCLSQYHPSMKDPNKPSASTSLLVIVPHKEGEIITKIGDDLARVLQKNIVITGGIHIDQASEQDIHILLGNLDQALTELKAQFYCTK